MQKNELKQIQNNITEMANNHVKNLIEFNRVKMDIFERVARLNMHMFNDFFTMTTNALQSFSKVNKIEDIAAINEKLLKESTNESNKISKEVLENIMQTSTDISKCIEASAPKPTNKSTVKIRR